MPRDALPPRPAVEIRPARREDAAVLVRFRLRLAAEAGLGAAPGEWDVLGPETWEDALIAERDGRAVGCALLSRYARPSSEGLSLELSGLFVEPERRGEGIGRALVAAALSQAGRRACSRVVVAEAGDAGFFAGLGFEALPGTRRPALASPPVEPG